jgi:prepilin-type N-terminal cleavage/methylation domain-containing protein
VKSFTKGFTLIELLATIAIIGILASAVLAAVGTSRAKARDSKRISGVSDIQLALELYYDSFQTYPATTPAGYAGPDATFQLLYDRGYLKSATSTEGNQNHYFGGVGNTTPYTECTIGSCKGYSISVLLERNDNIILTKDADARVTNGGVIFEGASTDCGTAVSAPDQCFDVTPLQIQQ